MFYTRPVGKFVINVCRTLSCAINGAERVTEELRGKLGIKPGETDASGTFTLMEVECLGACDRAPAVMVNDAWHECLTPEAAGKLVDDLRARGEAALSGCHHVVEERRAEGSGLRARADGFRSGPHQVRARAELLHARLLSAARRIRRAEDRRSAKKPDEIIELVTKAGLRGRGGAGFPTGMKWKFVDKKVEPRYIVCNADESEPGTFKDHLLMERNPHLLDRRVRDWLLRDRREGRLHLHPRRVLPRPERARDARSTRPTRRGISARTSSAPASTATSTCTAAPAPTRRARRRRCSSRSKASARSRATSRRSRRWSASTASRPRSTTSRRCATCRRS